MHPQTLTLVFVS